MPDPSISWDDLDVERALGDVDPAEVDTARILASTGAVQILATSDRRIRAVCPGGHRETFLVTVDLVDETRFGVDVEITCTCRSANGCLHGAATLLTHLEGPTDDPFTRSPRRGVGAGGPRDWRTVLAEPSRPRPTPRPLALQVVVDRPRATPWVPDPMPRLTLRPLRLGRSGRWIRDGAEWHQLLADDADGEHPVDQLAALRALTVTMKGAVHGDRALSTARSTPALWSLLDHLLRCGVVLVDERGQPTVEISPEPAHPVVDLTARPGGAARIAVGFSHEGRMLPDDAGSFGHPVHGVWYEARGGLHLVPLDAPLDPTSTILLREDVEVPFDEIDEFLDLHRPTLGRRVTLTSTDGSVSTDPDEFRGLVLHIERTALSEAALRWSVRYRRGDGTVDHPLHGVLGGRRDPIAETRAVEALPLSPDDEPSLLGVDGRPRGVTVVGADLLTLLDDIVPELVDHGVIVETTGDQPQLRRAADDPLIDLEVSRAEGADGNDWFDLEVSITVDGESVEFPVLFAALHEGADVLFLPSGTWLPLDSPRLHRLRELIDEARELRDPEPGRAARINRRQLGWWDDLDDLGPPRRTKAWRDAIRQLGPLSTPSPVPSPPGLRADLRPYQQDGLDWLAFLHDHRLGGILADDMGLGKTIQALSLCLHVKATRSDARFLVVAPTSVVENWAREAHRFAPDLRVRTITATEKRRGTPLADAVEGTDLVITSYALLRLEFEAYAALPWNVLFLDEAQFVKNPRGATHVCARDLDVATKIAITGTPLENSLTDLRALLEITAPGLFPDRERFDSVFRKPIESGAAPRQLELLRRRIAPLMRRRTKSEVLPDLPPKIEQRVDVDLDPRHARIYQRQLQRQRQKVLGLIGDLDQHRFEVLRSLTILRQLALHPGLVDPDHDGIASAKIDRLVTDLRQIVAEGHRALVFSQFTRFLGRIRDRLDEAGIAHGYLDGATRDRQAAISTFKDGDVPVFLISLKAGGFGLNLTEADYCFILDPWWNPATETQAVDRIHRIGQENPVFVYRYVSAGTIEEKVMDLKADKAALFDRVVDDGSPLSGRLEVGDVRGLLDLD